jgi:cytochrome c oxidase subunit 2
MDALPDGTNTLVLQADEPGVHQSPCAEFCGLQHARMALVVTAESPADFDAWLTTRKAPAAEPADEAARRGRDLFTGAGCAACHTVTGTGAAGRTGPDLTHVASRPMLGAGASPNTPEDLATWVRDPHSVKEGVAMPAPDRPDDELDALVAYVRGLR